MQFKPRFLVTLGMTGVAVAALYKACSQHLAERDKAQLRNALNRWEAEGGNLPPTARKP
ncbi:MAG: hypothetical protein JWP38_3413 [Herbaspirillum sp.]|jgi:hypothetical protein|nr:hypothetical protein [Herbaspirillum sp.]